MSGLGAGQSFVSEVRPVGAEHQHEIQARDEPIAEQSAMEGRDGEGWPDAGKIQNVAKTDAWL